MKYEWIDEFLLNLPAVQKDFQADWNGIRYKIGDKMFAAVCLNGENVPKYITLKGEPLENEFLRKEYGDIIPGYYMNKIHWNSVEADGNVPDGVLRDMLEKAYFLVLHGFSKKKQQEILHG